MPSSYSWSVEAEPLSGSAPDPGPGIPGVPLYGNARKKQFERGIKFGNVPGGNPDNMTHGGTRIFHVNTAMNIVQTPSDKSSLSGVVKFRNRRASSYKIPASISPNENRNTDEWGNEIFPWTGRSED